MNYEGEISIRYEKATMEDADAFFSAVADGDYDKMVQMLDAGKSDVNQTDSDGFSALMISASEGHEKIVEELIKRGCNVNSVTLNKNNTPLFFAAKGGNVNIGRMILSKNKKLINQCNILGETPLLWACYSGQYDFFMFLLSQKAELRAMSANDTTCLIGACLGQEPSRLQIVKHILKLIPKMIDVQDVDGQSALHVAASIGNLECVKYLIEAGADNTLRDVQGLTPLQVAEKACYPDCVEVLEKKWKELEDIAREEMEEFLRAEGYTDGLNEKRGKKKKNRRNKGKQEINQIHPDYQCDHCKNKKRIQGIRYRCKDCDDYDLCEACFSHVWDVHPHTHFIAYEPPQPDVFGILKEGPGREVLAPTKPVEEVKPVSAPVDSKESVPDTKESIPSNTKDSGSQTVKESIPSNTKESGSQTVKESIPSNTKDSGSQTTNEPIQQDTKEVESAPIDVTPSKEVIVTPTVKKETKVNDEEDWTVITEKRKKNRSASTYSVDHEEKKKQGKANEKKMNYKKAIQKSLTGKKKIPTLPTPQEKPSIQSVPSPTPNKPVEEQPSKQEPSPEQQVPSVPTGVEETPIDSYPLGNTSYNQDYSIPSEKLPLFGTYDNDFTFNDSLRFTHPSMDGLNYDFCSYPSNQVYYDNSQWWPKTHYGMWREKEMDMEREQWLFDESHQYPSYTEDDPYLFQHNPTYTSEELQRLLEMSNPSARAMRITVSQYLGLDLDYASDKQLNMLMDMHMEAIKQITSMKVRLAKTNERQRLLYPREMNEDPSNPPKSDPSTTL